MKKNYLFVIDRIENGGAERQMLTVAKYISDNKKVYITSLHKPSNDLLNIIKKYRFTYVPISTKEGKYFYERVLGVLTLIKSLKNILTEYKIDKCVSFLEWSNVLSIIAARDKGIPVYINVRNYLSRQYGSRHSLVLKIAKVIISRYYPHADAIICNSHGIKKDLVDGFQVPSHLISVIQNSYPIDEIQIFSADYKKTSDRKVFCACGRLSDQKRFESLILSFQKYIDESNRQDSLVIIGSGSNEEQIRGLIRTCNYDIDLLPHQENPLPIIANSDCFILHSDFEGFPNVLAEAIILGKDCISVDCMTGPRELLSGNVMTDYELPIVELKTLQYGLLYPYNSLQIEVDKELVNALHTYTKNNYQFDKSNYGFLCEKEGRKKWLKAL
ncbi:hypothetical protein A9Q75_05935 [Colwellia psychrerythraea]|uniref:Glycosyl transferase group 1 n=1 Tax=Colwellia psychrerythraea TaxID=28229 RepID=A0A1Y5EL73_COLPS|nr:hypothetical protein A9Q75_05935 [Colwellia psychrerythraea]